MNTIPPYQQRYLEALTALEDARRDAEQEERRMRFNAHGRQEHSRGYGDGERKAKRELTNPMKMALISGFHRAIIQHFIHDDGGKAHRNVIYAMNQKIRDYLEQMEVNAATDIMRPDGYTVTVTMPRQTFHISGFSVAQLDVKTETKYSHILSSIIDEYNAIPAPPAMTEREEYEAFAKRQRGMSLLDRYDPNR